MTTDHFSGTLSGLDLQVVRTVPPGGNWRDLPEDFPSQRIDQIRRTAAAGQGSRSTYYGRLRWDRPAYTISTFFSRPGNGCFIHPEAERLITVREAARLQSFPDDFAFAGPNRSRFLQVGNAVPPLLAYQIARTLPTGSLVDLFSGCGGLSLGFEMAGFKLLASADRDAAANLSFAMNHSRAEEPIALDLSDDGEFEVAMKEIKRRGGEDGVDVLAGGPPCQGFSTAGNCLTDDPRNRLVLAFVKAVGELRPRTVVMENVAALAFRRGAPILREVLRELEALGYRTAMALLHAEGYGVPQLRRRFFLLASMGDISWPVPWTEMSPPGHFRLQPGYTSHQDLKPSLTVRDAISDLPAAEVTDPDTAVTLESAPAGPYQRWARGEIKVSELVPDSETVEPDPVEWARLRTRVGGKP